MSSEKRSRAVRAKEAEHRRAGPRWAPRLAEALVLDSMLVVASAVVWARMAGNTRAGSVEPCSALAAARLARAKAEVWCSAVGGVLQVDSPAKAARHSAACTAAEKVIEAPRGMR